MFWLLTKFIEGRKKSIQNTTDLCNEYMGQISNAIDDAFNIGIQSIDFNTIINKYNNPAGIIE